MVDPLSIHGVVRDSPYSQLFVEIYHLTKPKSPDVANAMNEESLKKQRNGRNLNNFEDVSDPEDMEEGEIGEFDSPEVSPVKAETPCPYVEKEVNPFKVPPPPPDLRKFQKKQKGNVNLKKLVQNPKQMIESMNLSNKLPTPQSRG